MLVKTVSRAPDLWWIMWQCRLKVLLCITEIIFQLQYFITLVFTVSWSNKCVWMVVYKHMWQVNGRMKKNQAIIQIWCTERSIHLCWCGLSSLHQSPSASAHLSSGHWGNAPGQMEPETYHSVYNHIACFFLKKISLIWSRMVLLTRWYSSVIPGNRCICRWSRPLKWGPPLMLLHQHTGWEIGRGPHSNPVWHTPWLECCKN